MERAVEQELQLDGIDPFGERPRAFDSQGPVAAARWPEERQVHLGRLRACRQRRQEQKQRARRAVGHPGQDTGPPGSVEETAVAAL